VRDRERVHAETVEQWRAWLHANHATSTGVWLVSWKKRTGRPAVAYDDAVTEALAVGWVDSKPGGLDEERSMLWFAPRKPGSAWSRHNKHRIARLEAEGRLLEAGRRAVDAARADGSWTRLDAVEDLVVPDDLAAALDAHPGARAAWDGFPRSTRRGILEWIVQAKRPATRAARVTETAEKAARGERANQWPRR
jgi:uncharacterized protein YdeI (YjbR/CyaY-like superfamily)